MSRIPFESWINIEDTGEVGVDDKGVYKVQRVWGKEYCDCPPETCPHFDGIRYLDYEKKVYTAGPTTTTTDIN